MGIETDLDVAMQKLREATEAIGRAMREANGPAIRRLADASNLIGYAARHVFIVAESYRRNQT